MKLVNNITFVFNVWYIQVSNKNFIIVYLLFNFYYEKYHLIFNLILQTTFKRCINVKI